MRAGRGTDKHFWCRCPITMERALEGVWRGMEAWMGVPVAGRVQVGRVLLGLAAVPQGDLRVAVGEAVGLRGVAVEVEVEVVEAGAGVGAEVAVEGAAAAADEEPEDTLIMLYMYPP